MRVYFDTEFTGWFLTTEELESKIDVLEKEPNQEEDIDEPDVEDWDIGDWLSE